jgi:hypothetical protein
MYRHFFAAKMMQSQVSERCLEAETLYSESSNKLAPVRLTSFKSLEQCEHRQVVLCSGQETSNLKLFRGCRIPEPHRQGAHKLTLDQVRLLRSRFWMEISSLLTLSPATPSAFDWMTLTNLPISNCVDSILMHFVER